MHTHEATQVKAHKWRSRRYAYAREQYIGDGNPSAGIAKAAVGLDNSQRACAWMSNHDRAGFDRSGWLIH